MPAVMRAFFNPLEFYGPGIGSKRMLRRAARIQMIEEGLAVYERNQQLIVQLNRPPQDGDPSHDELARELKFRCPLLEADGRCGVYPMRELLGRLFGCSFNSAGGVYGCHPVGSHHIREARHALTGAGNRKADSRFTVYA